MSARPHLRVVAGADLSDARDSKRSLEDARNRARPLLKKWLRNIELEVIAGRLGATDFLVAKELTNYPSANEGRCYAGQKRLGAAVGVCDRTARRLLKRLSDAGLLASKRGGPGRTASWIFCTNGVPIFGGPVLCNAKDLTRGRERAISVQERTKMSGLDRTKMSDKPSELKPIEHYPSPLSPHASDVAPPQADFRGSEGPEGSEQEPSRSLDGEVLPPWEPTFNEFWEACGVYPGKAGPAIAAWRKLSDDDRGAIGLLITTNYTLDLDGMWAAVWLKERRWECSKLRRDVAFEFALRPVIQTAEPYSPEWHACRQRRVDAGESVALMDEFAKQDKGWSYQVNAENAE